VTTPLAQLAIEQDDDATVARIEGEIDLSNAAPLHQRIAESVPNGSSGLVIDLTHVTYLDSSGLRLLFDMARRLERRQQQLATVVRPNSYVREMLAMVGGMSKLGVRDTPEEGLARIRAEAASDDAEWN
jgi:anti-anti-sigma factor